MAARLLAQAHAGPKPLSTSQLIGAVTGTQGIPLAGFERAEGPRQWRFPDDHGPHSAFQTEWWYYTGNLVATSGEEFGYQLTFFRRSLVPPAQRTVRASAWGADQVYMAHFALTDVSGGNHHAFEKLARGAAGLAGAQAKPYRVWLEDWSASAQEAAGDIQEGAPVRLRAAEGDVAADLALRVRNRKPAVLHGEEGYSRKGPEPGNASYYYSLARNDTSGTITLNGKTYSVTGLSWMDHEFSTSALGAGQVGWDWFSLHLSAERPAQGVGTGPGGGLDMADGGELMVFQLRGSDGLPDEFSNGTLATPAERPAEGFGDGVTIDPLDSGDFSIQVTGHWRSPRTGAVYPSGWVISIPSRDLRLSITPKLDDQEMTVSPWAYWEGAVSVSGTAGGNAIAGSGYVELTGYASSLEGQF